MYRNRLAGVRPDHPFLDGNDRDLLLKLGAIKCVNGTELVPTWAGLWMFGYEQSIRQVLPYWHLSYRELPADPQDSRRWVDRVHPDGTWNANLMQFYVRASQRLFSGIKVPFEVREGSRVEDTDVHKALREALVNALVHADYQGTTGVRVIRKPARFEFINPGLLLISIEQLWQGGVSVPRNPALQRMFTMIGLSEREGSGGLALRNAWRAQHWRAPRVQEDRENNETHLELSEESLLPEWAVQQLGHVFGERFRAQDELGRLILVAAEVEGTINHGRMAEITDAHPRDITLKFGELVGEELLESSGRTHGTTYSVAGGRSEQRSEQRSIEVDSPGATGQVSRAEIERQILEYCAGGWRTLRDIATAVDRAETTIRTHYLRALLEGGQLEQRFPKKNHPKQSYRSVPTTQESQ